MLCSRHTWTSSTSGTTPLCHDCRRWPPSTVSHTLQTVSVYDEKINWKVMLVSCPSKAVSRRQIRPTRMTYQHQSTLDPDAIARASGFKILDIMLSSCFLTKGVGLDALLTLKCRTRVLKVSIFAALRPPVRPHTLALEGTVGWIYFSDCHHWRSTDADLNLADLGRQSVLGVLAPKCLPPLDQIISG